MSQGNVPAPLRAGNLNPSAAGVPTTGTTAPWAAQINAASQATGVPPQVLHAVMRAESNGNASSVSPKGALGLMQLMPGTAHTLGVDPMNNAQNIMGGAKYLASLHHHFGDWTQAIAAYNAGPAAQWPGPFAQSHDDPSMKVWQNPSNQGFAETRNYVTRITNDINSRKVPQGGQ